MNADKEADRILEAVEAEEIDGYQFALMAVKYFGTEAVKNMLKANLVDLEQPEQDMGSAFPELMSCPGCGGEHQEHMGTLGSVDWLKCKSCGVVWTPTDRPGMTEGTEQPQPRPVRDGDW